MALGRRIDVCNIFLVSYSGRNICVVSYLAAHVCGAYPWDAPVAISDDWIFIWFTVPHRSVSLYPAVERSDAYGKKTCYICASGATGHLL